MFSKKPFSSKYFNPLSGCKLNCLTPWRRILKSLNVTLDQETFLSIPARSIINFPQFEMSLMQYPGSPVTTLIFHVSWIEWDMGGGRGGGVMIPVVYTSRYIIKESRPCEEVRTYTEQSSEQTQQFSFGLWPLLRNVDVIIKI